jgi:hypothetical protein
VARKYDWDVAPNFDLSSSIYARGNNYRVLTHRMKYDLKKYFFTNRVANLNQKQLANLRIHFYWKAQEVIFDFKFNMPGARSRSHRLEVERHFLNLRS